MCHCIIKEIGIGVFSKAMVERGVERSLIERVREVYGEMKNKVRGGEGTSEVFWMDKGLR